MSSALSAGETRWRSWPRTRAILDGSGSEGDMVVSDVSFSPGAYHRRRAETDGRAPRPGREARRGRRRAGALGGATDGLSLAACAEPVIRVRCLGHGLEETVELLRRTVRGSVSTRRATTRAVYRHRASSQRALAGVRHSVETSLCAVPVLAVPG